MRTVYLMYITSLSAQSTWVSSEQNQLMESTTCFMHACLVSNASSSGLVSNSSSSGTCSPWSPASLSCGEAGRRCQARCSRSLPRYPQVRLSIWQTRKDIPQLYQSIYYYEFVISKLYLVYTIPTLTIWQRRNDILQLCQWYTIINLLYLGYTWYIRHLFNSWRDMPWICWTQSLIYLLYIVYTTSRHILFFLSMYLVHPWIFLRKSLSWFIPVLRTHLRYLGPEKINLVYPWCSLQKTILANGWEIQENHDMTGIYYSQIKQAWHILGIYPDSQLHILGLYQAYELFGNIFLVYDKNI